MFNFLHAADLHLGLRITRFDSKTAQKIREARFHALDNLLKQCSQQQVDCLIIAGDLFDDDAVDLKTAQRAFDMLEAAPAPVYVLPGNHDPLLAGGVWDRPPWSQAGRRVHLLNQQEPAEVQPGVWLYPCPVRRKTSLSDPTAWIRSAPPMPGAIRIGVAHGSLRIQDNLPDDDHLIVPDAAVALQLDYLALGHWHRRFVFKGSDGVERTAYPGVHEPMRSRGSSTLRTGWVPYGNIRNAEREEFLDAGVGEVLHVTIAGPGQPPEIRALQVGQLTWNDECRELVSPEDVASLIQDIATRVGPERQLLRLKVTGVLDADSTIRLEPLREIVEGRYFFGELDTSELRVKPTDEQLRAAAGSVVLRGVLEQLLAEKAEGAPEQQRVAERALILLYQTCLETRT